MNKGLIWSVTLHVGLFLLFLLGPGPKRFEWDRADAVSVDLVQLPALEALEPEPEPDLTPPAPTPPAPKPQEEPPPKTELQQSPPDPEPVRPAPKPKPKPKRVFKRYAPPKKEAESLAERLRQRLETDVTTEPEPSEAEPLDEASPAQAAVSTAEVEAVDFPYAWYLNVLRTKITAAWDPPGERMLAGRARQVVVEFRVHRDGRITDVRVGGASGTPGLDASARRAVDEGGPYPPLPGEFEGDWLDVGVRFTVSEGGA